MRADADGNLWIQTNLPGQTLGYGNPFRVFDGKGAETDQISLPSGTALAGFGAGVLYLISYDAGSLTLTARRIR